MTMVLRALHVQAYPSILCCVRSVDVCNNELMTGDIDGIAILCIARSTGSQ